MISKSFYNWIKKEDRLYAKRSGSVLMIACGYFITATEEIGFLPDLPEGEWYERSGAGWLPSDGSFFERILREPATRDMFLLDDTGAEMPVFVSVDKVNKVRVFLNHSGSNTLVSAQYFKFITDCIGNDFLLFQGERTNDPVFFMAPDQSGPLALLMPVNSVLVKYKVVEK